MNDHDLFLASALSGIIDAIGSDRTIAPVRKLEVINNLAPEIAAAARRIADAVMEERKLRPQVAA